MIARVGLRLCSQVSATEVIVVRVDGSAGDLSCGGWPMVEIGAAVDAAAAIEPDAADPTRLGKRYSTPNGGLEVLVTRAGPGRLAAGDVVLAEKTTAALPSSD